MKSSPVTALSPTAAAIPSSTDGRSSSSMSWRTFSRDLRLPVHVLAYRSSDALACRAVASSSVSASPAAAPAGGGR